MITIDASVLVAAASASDPARSEAAAFLAAAVRGADPIHQPTLSLVEVVAAIARRTGDEGLAQEAGSALVVMPGVLVQPLDLDASAEAAALAAHLGLRGADAVYVATALRHGTTLVTLDDEMLHRASIVIDVTTPSGWLARRPRSNA